MKINPRGDYVLLKTMEPESTTKGGLVLTTSAKENPMVFEVLAVGPGGMVDGKEVVMTLNVGDKVMIGKFGVGISADGMELKLIRQDDIIATVVD